MFDLLSSLGPGKKWLWPAQVDYLRQMADQLAPWTPQSHSYIVSEADFPVFAGEQVHAVCSTYTLAREFEWAGRRVFLGGRTEGTEAVGASVSVEHRSPAFHGEELTITATPTHFVKGFLTCACEARVGNRLIATGETGQKVAAAEKVAALLRKTPEG